METMIDGYIERGFPVVGVGDGAANLWAKCNQKIAVLSSGLVMTAPLKEKDPILEYSADELNFVDSFHYNQIYGYNSMKHPSFNNLLNLIAERVKFEIDTEAKEEPFSL